MLCLSWGTKAFDLRNKKATHHGEPMNSVNSTLKASLMHPLFFLLLFNCSNVMQIKSGTSPSLEALHSLVFPLLNSISGESLFACFNCILIHTCPSAVRKATLLLVTTNYQLCLPTKLFYTATLSCLFLSCNQIPCWQNSLACSTVGG